MPERFNRPATPADLVALALRIQRDERASRGEQLSEAARLSEQLRAQPSAPTDDADRLLWLIDHAQDPPLDTQARQARSALSVAGLIVFVLGLLSGAVVAAGVFYYDGRSPVNIVAALGVFVVLQGLLLLLAVVAALPNGVVGRLPGVSGVQEALRLASPGRLAFVGARLLPQDMREALSAALGRSGAHQRVYGRVQLWAILRWSQLYAVAVNLAAAGVFLYLVVVSDLAFSWSTTLDIAPKQFHTITHGLAAPWFWLDTALPSEQLVQRSFHYRGTEFDRELSKSWWPFILTAMLVYGLLPRIISAAVASVRLQRATRHALVAMPGAVELLRRVERADGNAASEPPTHDSTPTAATMGALGDRPMVIDWSGAAGSVARAVELIGAEPSHFEPAGGSRTVEEDRRAIEAVGRSATADGVAVLVKLWEPPVIETMSFLRELRSALGDGLAVRVLPVATDTSGRVISDDPVLVEQWRARVAGLGDPWTAVNDPVGLPERADD